MHVLELDIPEETGIPQGRLHHLDAHTKLCGCFGRSPAVLLGHYLDAHLSSNTQCYGGTVVSHPLIVPFTLALRKLWPSSGTPQSSYYYYD